MARQKKSDQKPIAQYQHENEQRANNPPVGLVTPETDPEEGSQKYAYDPHLDPQLVWAGKAEHTNFEVPTVSLHVHERIDPRSIIEAVRKQNPSQGMQLSLFETPEENPPIRHAIEFYKHKHNWSNRLVAGDSLLVMNSLLEKEGMAGQVQMIYFDPPYGIKYGSNFQPFVNKRDVKDGKDEDLTQEPEMIKAFRDTWELGIHSYLTYLRDRLLLARELLSESGSIFVQISDENVHHVRELMDELFNVQNYVSMIGFAKTSGLESTSRVSSRLDYIIWYAKDFKQVKYHQLFVDKSLDSVSGYTHVEIEDGTRRRLFQEETKNPSLLPNGAKIFTPDNLTKPGPGSRFSIEFEGRSFNPGNRWWGTTPEAIEKLIALNRLIAIGNSLRYVRYLEDFPYTAITNLWVDTGIAGFASDKVYVVQT
ncbi:MAG: DNA methyltransferase, partial [Microcoleaceae cyanobacterium]